MVPMLSVGLVAMDFLCCMGIGFFAAALRTAIPAQGGLLRFSADFACAFIALLFTQAYTAQSSNAGVLRFYMIISLLLGGIAFEKAIAPYQLFLVALLRYLVLFPARVLVRQLLKPLGIRVKKMFALLFGKMKKARKKKRKAKQLQSSSKILYNSNIIEKSWFE